MSREKVGRINTVSWSPNLIKKKKKAEKAILASPAKGRGVPAPRPGLPGAKWPFVPTPAGLRHSAVARGGTKQGSCQGSEALAQGPAEAAGLELPRSPGTYNTASGRAPIRGKPAPGSRRLPCLVCPRRSHSRRAAAGNALRIPSLGCTTRCPPSAGRRSSPRPSKARSPAPLVAFFSVDSHNAVLSSPRLAVWPLGWRGAGHASAPHPVCFRQPCSLE